MQKRKIGNTNIEVTPLMFGGNVLGWTIDQELSFQILDRFVGAGFDFIDTADVYSNWVPGNKGGESETILGNWMKSRGNRKKIILATKLGFDMGPGQAGLSKKYITQAVEASLTRLQTDYIDLYQSHTDDKETPMEETLSAFTDLIKAGKVRAIGASNHSAERLTQSLEISKKNNFARYESLQPLYNLYDRQDFEQGAEKVCVAENLSVINYYSLAAGFLSGKYRSADDFSGQKSKRGERVKKYFTDRGLKILKALDQVAQTHRTSPSQVAMAWLYSRPSVTAPIVSATNLGQLEELFQSVKLNLSAEDLQVLNQASDY